MVRSYTRLPSPTLGQNDIKVCFVKIPGIVRIMPGTTTYEAVAYAVMHLAGKAVGIAAVVAVVVAVVV